MQLLYIGAHGQYEGFDRVNVVVPRSLAGWGKVADVLTVDRQTANVVTINVE